MPGANETVPAVVSRSADDEDVGGLREGLGHGVSAGEPGQLHELVHGEAVTEIGDRCRGGFVCRTTDVSLEHKKVIREPIR